MQVRAQPTLCGVVEGKWKGKNRQEWARDGDQPGRLRQLGLYPIMAGPITSCCD